MTLRDDLLPIFPDLRSIPDALGLRRFAVILRRRVWAGEYAGDPPVTNEDVTIAPRPRVEFKPGGRSGSPGSLEYVQQNGAWIDDRSYLISRITPAFVGGGYTAQQLTMRPPPDVKNVEPVVILVGDDGYARECVQAWVKMDRAFGYSMRVDETDRPRTALSSLVVTASGTKLTATGTFEDGMTADLSGIVRWSSSDPAVAAVNLLGAVTEGVSGTANVEAALGSVTSSPLAYVVP